MDLKSIYRILTLGLFTALCAFQFSALAQTADYSPSRFFDGKALAADLARWLVEQKPPQEFLKRNKAIPFNIHKLANGQVIYFQSNSPQFQELEAWLLSQPDDSVTPLEFYQKCFSLTEYRVHDAMTLAWDYLVPGWDKALERNNTPQSRKLFDITGEQAVYDGSYHFRPSATDRNGKALRSRNGALKLDLRVTKRGDKRGAWYHFTGTALASYWYNYVQFPFSKPWLVNYFVLRERAKYPITSGIANQKRLSIDRAGALLGFHLSNGLENSKEGWKLKQDLAEYTEPIFSDRPDIYGDDYVLKKGQHPVDYGRKVTIEEKDHLNYFISLLEKHNELLYGFDAIALNMIRIFTSSDGERILKGLKIYSELPKANPVFDQRLALILKDPPLNVIRMDLSIDFDTLTDASKERVISGWGKFVALAFKALEAHHYPDVEELKKQFYSRPKAVDSKSCQLVLF